MEQKIKKAGFKMTVMMGVILSLYMSLYNNFSSGNFSPVMLLISFVVSLMISILVGLIVPMPKISRALAQKIKPGPGLRAVDALVSDAIYTPIITFFMILVVRNLAPVLAGKGAEREALAGGAPAEVAANVAAGAAAEARASFPPFVIMFIKSFLICYALGFFVIYVAQPILMKIAFKGIEMPGPGGPGKKPEQKSE